MAGELHVCLPGCWRSIAESTGGKKTLMKLPRFAIWFCNVGKSNRRSTECWSHTLARGKDRPGCFLLITSCFSRNFFFPFPFSASQSLCGSHSVSGAVCKPHPLVNMSVLHLGFLTQQRSGLWHSRGLRAARRLRSVALLLLKEALRAEISGC